MIEHAATLIAFLGPKAAELVGNTVKDHVKRHLGNLLTAAEQKALGQQYVDALQVAYESTLTHAYSRTLNALGRVLELTGISFSEFYQYMQSVERFLRCGPVAEHLLATVRDLSNSSLPDPTLLEREWRELDGREFPTPGVWIMVAANFRASAREKVFVTPNLREVLNAQNLDQIRQLQEKLVGVQVRVRHEQYIDRMQKKYAGIELANVAPSYAEDPGRLVVTDIFEPQHVRENPPPVEITKDEFDKLAREGKIDKNDEAAIVALLDDGDGEHFTNRLRFQRASYTEQPVRPVFDVISGLAARLGEFSKHNRLLVITGEPGSGKSTLLRYLLLGVLNPPIDPSTNQPLSWTTHFTGDRDHFPLLIELRDYYFTCKQEPDVNSFLDYVNYLGQTQGYGIDAQWLRQRLTDGPSLVMFDGLDEIFDAGDRDRMMQEIVGFVQDHDQARVIVTSRPHGYHEGILRPAGFAHFRLQDLDRQQQTHFTTAWFARVFPSNTNFSSELVPIVASKSTDAVSFAPDESDASPVKQQVHQPVELRLTKDAQQRIERVLSSIDRSPSVRWLAGNPLLLTIMCLIAREKELPRERARFYEQCIDVLAHQWDVNRHLADENFAFLDIEDKKELLRRIAFQMQGSSVGLRGNFIAESELLKITQEWFEERFSDYTGAKARLAAQGMIKGLWQRNYLLCPRGPKLFGFLHRTFMEFLTATEYVRRFEKTTDFKLDALDAVFRQHGNEPEWQEVLRLICGEIGDQYAEQLIRTLLTLKEFPTEELTEENQPNHLVLAIRCMSELRGLAKLESLGEAALEKCVEFLACGATWSDVEAFVRNDWLDAVAEVGERWPRREWLHGKLPKFEPGSSISCVFWPEFAVSLLPDQTSVFQFMRTLPAETDYRYFDTTLASIVRRWPNAATRDFLSQRAVEDIDFRVRRKALELLAGREAWAEHEETVAVRRRIHTVIRDPSAQEQSGRLACMWLGTLGRRDVPEDSPLPLEKIRDAARRVFSRDADGFHPFLDPRRAVFREHLAKVARRAGLSDSEIERLVAVINHALGWDIRRGLPK